MTNQERTNKAVHEYVNANKEFTRILKLLTAQGYRQEKAEIRLDAAIKKEWEGL